MNLRLVGVTYDLDSPYDIERAKPGAKRIKKSGDGAKAKVTSRKSSTKKKRR